MIMLRVIWDSGIRAKWDALSRIPSVYVRAYVRTDACMYVCMHSTRMCVCRRVGRASLVGGAGHENKLTNMANFAMIIRYKHLTPNVENQPTDSVDYQSAQI